MKILIISDQKKIKESFYNLNKSNYEVEIVCKANYKQYIKKLSEPAILYFDIFQNSETEYWKEIKSLLKLQKYFLGIIDSKTSVQDPASFFHAGVVDYITKKQLYEGISQKRIKNILDFKKEILPEKQCEKNKKIELSQNRKEFSAGFIPNGEWINAEAGKEYVFYFLFAEIDLASDWKKKCGQAHLKQIKDVFYNYIRQHIEPANGRIWMWNEFGGLALIPYTKKYPDIAVTASKLIAHAPIASCEDFPFKMEISYRLALHIGETTYKERGKTGTIVSDSINFIFHLGQKFAKPGNFYLTEETYHKIHPGLKKLFLPDGIFEDKNILRLKRFILN